MAQTITRLRPSALQDTLHHGPHHTLITQSKAKQRSLLLSAAGRSCDGQVDGEGGRLPSWDGQQLRHHSQVCPDPTSLSHDRPVPPLALRPRHLNDQGTNSDHYHQPRNRPNSTLFKLRNRHPIQRPHKALTASIFPSTPSPKSTLHSTSHRPYHHSSTLGQLKQRNSPLAMSSPSHSVPRAEGGAPPVQDQHRTYKRTMNLIYPNDEREYIPIADHGLIGNLRTAALVGLDGGSAYQ